MSSICPSSQLPDELQAMRALLELMRQEQRQLIAAEIEALDALTPRKTALVGQLSQLSGARHARLAAAGFPGSEPGMAAWLAATTDAGASQLWSELLDNTRQAKELNRLNGMLINKHLARARDALRTLNPAAHSSHTYGPSGQTSTGPSSRRLVVG